MARWIKRKLVAGILIILSFNLFAQSNGDNENDSRKGKADNRLKKLQITFTTSYNLKSEGKQLEYLFTENNLDGTLNNWLHNLFSGPESYPWSEDYWNQTIDVGYNLESVVSVGFRFGHTSWGTAEGYNETYGNLLSLDYFTLMLAPFAEFATPYKPGDLMVSIKFGVALNYHRISSNPGSDASNYDFATNTFAPGFFVSISLLLLNKPPYSLGLYSSFNLGGRAKVGPYRTSDGTAFLIPESTISTNTFAVGITFTFRLAGIRKKGTLDSP